MLCFNKKKKKKKKKQVEKFSINTQLQWGNQSLQIKNTFKYLQFCSSVKFTLPHVRNLISRGVAGCNHVNIIYQCSSGL